MAIFSISPLPIRITATPSISPLGRGRTLTKLPLLFQGGVRGGYKIVLIFPILDSEFYLLLIIFVILRLCEESAQVDPSLRSG